MADGMFCALQHFRRLAFQARILGVSDNNIVSCNSITLANRNVFTNHSRFLNKKMASEQSMFEKAIKYFSSRLLLAFTGAIGCWF